MSEIFHKWFSFQIFDYPFSPENNALGQIGWNSRKHTTLTLMHTHTSARKKELEKIRVQWHYQLLNTDKEPLEKSISEHTAALQHSKLYSLPSTVSIPLRELRSNEVNGLFVTNSYMIKFLQQHANTLAKPYLPAAFRIMVQRTTQLKNWTVVQRNEN